MTAKRRGERLLSRALELSIVALVVLVAFEVVSRRDPFECSAEGRRLSDDELARESLAFLRGEQVGNAVTPGAMPEGYDTSDAVVAKPRFGFEVIRDGDGPGDVLKPRRSWPQRQIFGARLAVSLTLPGDTAEAPALQVLHVSDSCGHVLVDWGHTKSAPNPVMAPAETD